MAQPFTATDDQLMAAANTNSTMLFENESIATDAQVANVWALVAPKLDTGGNNQTAAERRETIWAIWRNFVVLGTSDKRDWTKVPIVVPNAASTTAGGAPATALTTNMHELIIKDIHANGCTIRSFAAKRATLGRRICKTLPGDPALMRKYQIPSGFSDLCFDFNHGLSGLSDVERSVCDAARQLALHRSNASALNSTAVQYHQGSINTQGSKP